MPWRPARDGRGSWPVVLRDASTGPPLVLRPLVLADQHEWQRVRSENADHVRPWEPTLPPGAEPRSPVSFRDFVTELDREARADRAMPWVIEVGGRIAGQVHLFGIVRAAQQSCAAGYWVSRGVTRRKVATRALALAVDHALGPAGLHRVEVNIRVDNERSLGVARGLGLRDEGVRVGYLHIDGAWRDHRSFAVTRDDLGGGSLMDRLSQP